MGYALTFQVIPPLIGFIVTALQISHTQVGALMGIFALPGIFLSVPAGILSDLYGPRKAGLVALAVTVAGTLLVGLCNNFYALALGRFIAGAGALVLLIAAPQAISYWFTGKYTGFAMGLFNAFMPVGAAIALNSFGRLALASNWRVPVLLVALYGTIVFLVFYFKFPERPEEEKLKGKTRPGFKEAFSGILKFGGPVFLLGVVWMLFNAAWVGYVTFISDHYISLGHSVGQAGFLASLLMIGSVVFGPLVGILIDKTGRSEYYIITASAALTGLFLLVSYPSFNPYLSGILIGFFGSVISVPIFTLAPQFLAPQHLGLGYGVLTALLNVGMLGGPLFVGMIFDQTGSYFYGFLLVSAMMLIAFICSIALKYLKHKKEGAG